ncbi:MAG: aldolase [Clostridia bacterium]|nr:aldolase [Clostridia bacterium]
MALKLMYITNRTDIAKIAEAAGVDRIFVDLEYIGKNIRQGGMDTVQNRHTPSDAAEIKKVLNNAQLLVRVNPIHNSTQEYCSTEEEIDAVINAGADIIMLPYFKTADDVKRFITAVDGRAKTMLLFESAKSIENIDSILKLEGIDEVYIGLNDLSLDYGRKFLFSILADGTVEKIAKKFKEKKLPFGFGGMATLDGGALPGKKVLPEHYALGSTCVILSRAFCNTNVIQDLDEIKITFENGVKKIREYEEFCSKQNEEFFYKNHSELQNIVDEICK